MSKLSIIVPFYNEEKTVLSILAKLKKLKLSGWSKEIIVVDDGSSDNSKLLAKNWSSFGKNVKFFTHKKNSGKGAAIQTGVKHARGEFMIIQDCDLEYNPEDIKLILNKKKQSNSDIVLGSRDRVLRGKNYVFHSLGINLTTMLFNFLYGTKFSDVYTCYKLFNLKSIKESKVKSNGFEWDLEALSKLLKMKPKCSEIEINYNPRKISEGKKIRPWHGIIGLWVVIINKFNLY